MFTIQDSSLPFFPRKSVRVQKKSCGEREVESSSPLCSIVCLYRAYIIIVANDEAQKSTAARFIIIAAIRLPFTIIAGRGDIHNCCVMLALRAARKITIIWHNFSTKRFIVIMAWLYIVSGLARWIDDIYPPICCSIAMVKMINYTFPPLRFSMLSIISFGMRHRPVTNLWKLRENSVQLDPEIIRI